MQQHLPLSWLGIQLSETEALFLTASHPGNWTDRTWKTLNSHHLAFLANSRDKESNCYFTFWFQCEAESTIKFAMFFAHIKYWASVLKEWLKRLLKVLGGKILCDLRGGFVAAAASSVSLLGFVNISLFVYYNTARAEICRIHQLSSIEQI